MKILILFLICLFIQGQSCKNPDKTNGGLKIEDNKSDKIAGIIKVENVKNLSLKDSEADFIFSKDEVREFFRKSEKINEKEAVDLLKENNYIYNVTGDIIIDADTLQYLVNASGVGIIFTESVELADRGLSYYRNSNNIPKDIYQKPDSEINIFSYDKQSFDFSIWKEWQEDDPETFIDNNEEYNSYVRWNKLNVYDIYKAFDLSVKTTSEEISYNYYVNPYCNITGFLIKKEKIYLFWMEAGGVFHLFPNGNLFLPDAEIYGCFEQECGEYFINTLGSIY